MTSGDKLLVIGAGSVGRWVGGQALSQGLDVRFYDMVYEKSDYEDLALALDWAEKVIVCLPKNQIAQTLRYIAWIVPGLTSRKEKAAT